VGKDQVAYIKKATKNITIPINKIMQSHIFSTILFPYSKNFFILFPDIDLFADIPSFDGKSITQTRLKVFRFYVSGILVFRPIAFDLLRRAMEKSKRPKDRKNKLQESFGKVVRRLD